MGEQIKTTAEAAEEAVLRKAHAVALDSAIEPRAEKRAMPKGSAEKSVTQKSPAEWAYERIVMYIQSFEEQLNNDEEVGMGYAGGDIGTLRIQGMGFYAPDLITFYGQDPSGAKTQLVQHVSQLNVMLVATPKDVEQDEPRRIGFTMVQDLEGA